MTIEQSAKNKVTLGLSENEVIDSEQVLNGIAGTTEGGILVPVFTTAGTVQSSGNGEDDWEAVDLDSLSTPVNLRRYFRATAAADVEFVII